jgi:hypothetical protein
MGFEYIERPSPFLSLIEKPGCVENYLGHQERTIWKEHDFPKDADHNLRRLESGLRLATGSEGYIKFMESIPADHREIDFNRALLEIKSHGEQAPAILLQKGGVLALRRESHLFLFNFAAHKQSLKLTCPAMPEITIDSEGLALEECEKGAVVRMQGVSIQVLTGPVTACEECADQVEQTEFLEI